MNVLINNISIIIISHYIRCVTSPVEIYKISQHEAAQVATHNTTLNIVYMDK